MRNILSLATATLLCVVATSCTTTHPKATTGHPIQVSVRAKADTVYKVLLDGKVVDNGKGKSKSTTTFSFSAPLGTHILKVTAPGTIPWERSIQVAEEETRPQYFYVVLQQK